MLKRTLKTSADGKHSHVQLNLKEIISSAWAAQKLVPLTTGDFWNGKNPEVTERISKCRKKGKHRIRLKCAKRD